MSLSLCLDSKLSTPQDADRPSKTDLGVVMERPTALPFLTHKAKKT